MHKGVGRLTGGHLQAENRGIEVFLPSWALGLKGVPEEGQGVEILVREIIHLNILYKLRSLNMI